MLSQYTARSLLRVSVQSLVNRPIRLISSQDSSNDEPIAMENPFLKEKVKCVLCRHNIQPSYKNVELLSQFQSPYTGRIYGRHITGLCKTMQERVEVEICKAQNVALMGVMTKEVSFLKDPKLYDPEKPIRPHKY